MKFILLRNFGLSSSEESPSPAEPERGPIPALSDLWDPFLVFKLKAGILRGFLPESFLPCVVQPNTRFRSHKGSSCKYLITFLCTALSPPDPECPTSSLDLTWHPQCDETTVFCLDSVSFYYGVKGAHRQKSDLNTGLKLFFFFFQELYFCTGIKISWFHSSLQQKACPVPVFPLW